jgi:hypothetical protein
MISLIESGGLVKAFGGYGQVEKAQNPMFQMLGTPSTEKSHVILDTPPDVTEQRSQRVKAVLD